MSDCKIYPADTVDIYGNVWPTVGENIRNGMFGEKIKAGKIKINKGKVTSQDVNVYYTQNDRFDVHCNVIFFYPLSCSEGCISLRVSMDPFGSVFNSFTTLENVIGEIVIIYSEA